MHRTHEMPVISVQGPGSRQMLQGLTDHDVAALGYFRFHPERVQLAGLPVWLLRTGFSGELGYELIPDRGDAVELWNTLRGLGARPIGLDAHPKFAIATEFSVSGAPRVNGTPFHESADPRALPEYEMPPPSRPLEETVVWLVFPSGEVVVVICSSDIVVLLIIPLNL